MRRLRQSAEWRLVFGAIWQAHRPLAALWTGLLVLRALLPPALAISMGVLVSAVKAGRPLGGPLVLLGIVFIAFQALSPLHSELSRTLAAVVTNFLNDRLMRASVGPQGMAHLEDPALADDFTLARDFDIGVTGPSLIFSMSFVANGLVEIASGAVGGLILFAYHWWAPFFVCAGWLSTHVLLRESAVWREWRSAEVMEHQRHADYAYRIAVDAPAAKELRLFGLGGWATNRFATRRRRLLDMSLEAMRLRERSVVWTMLVILVGNGLFFWALATDAAAGRVSLGAGIVFAQTAVGASALAFGEFDWWFRTAAQPVPVVESLEGAMQEVGGLASGTASAHGMPAQEILFRSVRFTYETNEQPVLDGLDLAIPAGTSMAIVGQNGAGKTTLAKLLCRFYDPQDGAIEVDGVDIRDLELTEWRSRVAAVFQDYVKYERPLRENVAPAGAPDDVILRSLEDAGARDLADLDTILSRQYAGGTDLSGGQWQRVALARAICALHLGAGVVILDEPTAQLDVRGEAEIFDRILQATKGKTTILVSHRFSTVRHADRIAVVEAGRVVELGSHEELMALGGRYRTMFELQAGRFAEPEEEQGEVLV